MRFDSYPAAPARNARLMAVAITTAIAAVLCAMLYSGGMVAVAATALVVLAAVAMFVNPEVATLLVIFVIYSDAAAVAVRSYGVPSGLAVGFFLLLFFPAMYYVVFRREEIRVDGGLGWMLVYFAIALASALGSRNPGESVRPLLTYVFEGLCIYFLILNTVRTPGTLRRVTYVLLCAATFLGVLSLVQAATSTYNKSYGGFALTEIIDQNGAIAALTETEEKDANGRTINRNRAVGPFGDPNYYGQMMTAVLPFAAVLALSGRPRKRRMLGVAACATILGAIALTYSRGAALCVVLLILLLAKFRHLKLRYALLIVPAIVVVVSVVPAYQTRLSTLAGLQSGGLRQADASVWLRATVLRAGAHVFVEHPLLGIGFGQSGTYIAGYANANGFDTLPAGIAAHNTYLQQLVETGILGLTAFLLIAFFTLRNVFRLHRYWRTRNLEYANQLSAIGLAVLAFLATSVFLHLSFMRYYFLLLGIAGAAVAVYGSEAAEETASAPAVLAGTPVIASHGRM